jgi:hypothetical protein
MVTVDKLGGKWVISRTGGANASGDVDDPSGSQDDDLTANRQFWTGDAWAGQYGLAKPFGSQEEAETYLTQHRHELI